MIMDCKYTVPPHVSEGCRRLIGRMLQRDPSKRANLDDIANDPWLQTGSNMVTPSSFIYFLSLFILCRRDSSERAGGSGRPGSCDPV